MQHVLRAAAVVAEDVLPRVTRELLPSPGIYRCVHRYIDT